MRPSAQKYAKTPMPESMAGFASPFSLVEHLRKPKMKLDLVPILDLLTIGMMMSLMFTRFVMVPGVRIDLPDSNLRMQHHDISVAVLTIGNKGMLYFDGSVYEQASIERALMRHIEVRSGDFRESVLLVKAEGTMQLESLLELCSMAQAAGFTQIQIAGEKKDLDDTSLSSGGINESPQFVPTIP